MHRILALGYGLFCYLIFFGTFLYMMGFVGNLLVPKSMDVGLQTPFLESLAVNGLLVLLFALQHSVMARPAFKRMVTRVIPPAAERSTYVLCSSLALILLFWQWRPMGPVLWDIESIHLRNLVYAAYLSGWIVILLSSCLIHHFDLFGLRQVWLYFRGRDYEPVEFGTPGWYRWVRHPLYVGWLMTFWISPTMSLAHLVFAAGMTVYILVAIRYEERDLVECLGEDYAQYRRETPMLIPGLKPRSKAAVAGE